MTSIQRAFTAIVLLLAAAGCRTSPRARAGEGFSGPGPGPFVEPSATPRHHYLFAYFKGEGRDGLHLAHSTDGMTWRALRGDSSFLQPTVGRERIMRDPMILRGPDGLFHMVWTVGLGLAKPEGVQREAGIGYATSPDLGHWSEQRYLPVMAGVPAARNAWAPELSYDGVSRRYLIFWSSTVVGRFPATDGQLRKGRSWDPGWDHRIYFATTTDFQSFSAPALLYEPGFNVIDATMARAGGRYLLFVKDETDQPFTPKKNIRLATAASPTGPWSTAAPAVTGAYWVEGPSAVRMDGVWHVYFDKYMEGKYGVVLSQDLTHWADASDRLSMPPGARHGTVFEVPASVAQGLLGASGALEHRLGVVK